MCVSTLTAVDDERTSLVRVAKYTAAYIYVVGDVHVELS